jgi:hypothetical protein
VFSQKASEPTVSTSFPSAMSHFKQVRQLYPTLSVRQEVPDEVKRARAKKTVKTDARKTQTQRIWLTQGDHVVLHERPDDATAFPTTIIKKSAELEIRRTKSEILDNPKSSIVDFPRVNCGSVRNSPVVIASNDCFTHSGRTQLGRGLCNSDRLSIQKTHFSRSPDRVWFLADRSQTFCKMVLWENVIVIHSSNMRTPAIECGEISVCVEAAMRSTNVATVEFLRDHLNFRDELMVGIVRDNDFKRLLILVSQTE